MTQSTIEKRIASKQKEITTLEKKLERIERAKDSGWKKNPYKYTEANLKEVKAAIKASCNQLAEYQNMLKGDSSDSSEAACEPSGDADSAKKDAVTDDFGAVIDELIKDWEKKMYIAVLNACDAYQIAYREYRARNNMLMEQFNASRGDARRRAAIQNDTVALRQTFKTQWAGYPQLCRLSKEALMARIADAGSDRRQGLLNSNIKEKGHSFRVLHDDADSSLLVYKTGKGSKAVEESFRLHVDVSQLL